MCTECFSWCHLHIPWGAKKQSMEMEPLEVSTVFCCANSPTCSCVQKLETYRPAITPASTSVENENQVIKPKSDEVRWLAHFLQCSDIVVDLGKLSDSLANNKRLRHGYHERGSNPIPICSRNRPNSISERGHWSCTEDS